jgi:transcriptional regulator with XRE-family HTH domain
MKVDMICAGFGGQGVLTTGLILADAGMKLGMNILWYPSYGSEMRGGTANCTVKFSDEEIASPYAKTCDILMAMNAPAIDKFQERIKPGGLLLLNSSLVHEDKKLRSDIRVVRVPMADIAAQYENFTVGKEEVLRKLCYNFGKERNYRYGRTAMTFGETLRKLLNDAGVKQFQLATRLGYDVSYISRWISGEKVPSVRNNKAIFDEIAAYLVISGDDNGRSAICEDFSLDGNLSGDELAHRISSILAEAYGSQTESRELQAERAASSNCMLRAVKKSVIDHSRHVIRAEEAGEQLAAGGKAGSGVRNEEYDDNNCRQQTENIILIMVAAGEELRERIGVCNLRVAAQTPSGKKPVQIGPDGKADDGPAHIRHSGQVGEAGQAHKKVAGHIRSFGAHGGYKRAQLPAAEVKVGRGSALLCVVGTDQDHSHQIDKNGNAYANLCAAHAIQLLYGAASPSGRRFGRSPPLRSREMRDICVPAAFLRGKPPLLFLRILKNT